MKCITPSTVCMMLLPAIVGKMRGRVVLLYSITFPRDRASEPRVRRSAETLGDVVERGDECFCRGRDVGYSTMLYSSSHYRARKVFGGRVEAHKKDFAI